MGPEFQLIEAFVAAARASPPAPAGPGDDAAVLSRPRGEICVTVDAVVEAPLQGVDQLLNVVQGEARVQGAALRGLATVGRVFQVEQVRRNSACERSL